MTGIGAGSAALAGAILVACAGIALADPAGPVQPGVTAPIAPTTSAAPKPAAPPPAAHPPAAPAPVPDQLHSAAPQDDNQASAPRRRYTRPSTPTPTPPPAPREVHIGPLSAPVPGAVPDSVVNGVNQTNQDLESVLKPTTTPQPKP